MSQMNGGARRGSKKGSKGKKSQRGGGVKEMVACYNAGGTSAVIEQCLAGKSSPADAAAVVAELSKPENASGKANLVKNARACFDVGQNSTSCIVYKASTGQAGGKRRGSKKGSKKGGAKKGSKKGKKY